MTGLNTIHSLPFDEWRKDPEFNALSRNEQNKIALNYFHQTMTDMEFYSLPPADQHQVTTNFLNQAFWKGGAITHPGDPVAEQLPARRARPV